GRQATSLALPKPASPPVVGSTYTGTSIADGEIVIRSSQTAVWTAVCVHASAACCTPASFASATSTDPVAPTIGARTIDCACATTVPIRVPASPPRLIVYPLGTYVVTCAQAVSAGTPRTSSVVVPLAAVAVGPVTSSCGFALAFAAKTSADAARK